MISSVIPRPIALVSTIAADGITNLTPFSWFNGVSADPPIVSLAIGTKRRGAAKDTVNNLRAVGELVIHLVTETMLDPIVVASGEWPAEVDEFEVSRLTPVASKHVRPPRVAESPLAMECLLEQIVAVSDTSLVLARVIGIEVDERVLRDGMPAPDLLAPVSRLGGELYATLGTLVARRRPSIETPAADPLNRKTR